LEIRADPWQFNAAAWVNAVTAIQGIEAYVGRRGDEEWLGVTFRYHSPKDKVTEEGMDRYLILLHEMNAAEDGRDAVKAELERRGRVIVFRDDPS
jgi:hypothetical protein